MIVWQGMRSPPCPAAVALVLAAVVSTANPAAAGPADHLPHDRKAARQRTDAKHKGEIQIDRTRSATRQPRRRHRQRFGQGRFQDLHVLIHGDAASMKLFQAVIDGKHFPKAVLTVERSWRSATPYLVVTLDEVVITAFTVGQSAPTASRTRTSRWSSRRSRSSRTDLKPCESGRPVPSCA